MRQILRAQLDGQICMLGPACQLRFKPAAITWTCSHLDLQVVVSGACCFHLGLQVAVSGVETCYARTKTKIRCILLLSKWSPTLRPKNLTFRPLALLPPDCKLTTCSAHSRGHSHDHSDCQLAAHFGCFAVSSTAEKRTDKHKHKSMQFAKFC